jgi:hypothetical protein
MWTDLEAEIRPLMAVIRVALTEVMAAPTQDTVACFLNAAPVESCVRLAEAWAVAEAVGVPTQQLKAKFDAEDQFLIELVTSVYTASKPKRDTGDFLDMPELARLLDEMGKLG